MSAGRSHRRRIQRDALRCAPGRYIPPRTGPILLVLPGLQEGWPAEILNALVRRNAASVNGRCACGAEFVLDSPLRPGHVTHAVMEHEEDCPAGDEVLGALFRRYGVA